MRPTAAAVACAGLALAGCGLGVKSPDLFLLTRTGQGEKLTMLVNDGGTIRCNRGRSRPLSDHFLLQARDIAENLDSDVQNNVHFDSPPSSTFTFTVRLMDGTISFPDTAAPGHHEISDTELFALQAAQQACGLNP
ncbi:MAG TPA: hypothetical protein VIL82_08140 [Solirubrobacteraceae bacterium]